MTLTQALGTAAIIGWAVGYPLIAYLAGKYRWMQ